MSSSTLVSSGVILLIVVTVAFGGTFLLRVFSGGVPANGLQKSFFRAGHAHAGVLIILGLVIRLLLADDRVPAWSRALGDGVLYAAVLMSAGFFLSVLGKDPQKPSRMIVLLWLGVASLVIGVVGAGCGLIVAGLDA
ncbi:hypothetical protein GCM10025789_28130 [Tessaracoccus lubricantis]|uniref:Uncharacterized protein n=1 Tax=Tessaracoccus lubricantis TaxID=545543 RepID=A0ABP9FLQ6_9ACTN